MEGRIGVPVLLVSLFTNNYYLTITAKLINNE